MTEKEWQAIQPHLPDKPRDPVERFFNRIGTRCDDLGENTEKRTAEF